MKRILRNGLCVLLAGVLLLSLLFAGVAWAGLDDETTQIPTVEDKITVDTSEDEMVPVPIDPGTAGISVLYSWTASDLANDSKVFSSNLTDDTDARQRWNESAIMYTHKQIKQMVLHTFLNEAAVDSDGTVYGLTQKQDAYGRTAVDNLSVDFYPMAETENMRAVGLSFVYAHKPADNGMNPANSGLLRIYVSEDGTSWSEDYVGVRSAHILGSGTTTDGEEIIYYQVFSENLLSISSLTYADEIKMLRIMPDGVSGIAGGSFSLCSLDLTGYGQAADFATAVPDETGAVSADTARTKVLDAAKNSTETTDLDRILDAISLVTPAAPEDIPNMLDTLGLRLMDGIAFKATEDVEQIFEWMYASGLKSREEGEEILAEYETITTTQKLLQELNRPQRVFRAYAACKPGDLLVQITATGSHVYMVVSSSPVYSSSNENLNIDPTESYLTYLDAGKETTATFFSLYSTSYLVPMTVDALADDTVQPTRVDGHISVADGVQVAVSANWDIESYTLSTGTFQDTVNQPGAADIYASTRLDDFVEALEPGKYQMTVDVKTIGGIEQPEPIVLEFSVESDVSGIIKPTGISMSLEEVVYLNIYTTLADFDPEVDLTSQAGLLVWTEDPGTVEQALTKLDSAEKVPGAVLYSDGHYMVRTEGIPAAYWGDTQYMLVYVDCGTSSVYASSVLSTSPKDEALWLKGNDRYGEIALAMLNYGAAAQTNFGYKADQLMNASLTEAEKTLNWNEEWLVPVQSADAAKTANFPASEFVKFEGDSLTLKGAINLNFYVSVTAPTVQECGLLFWPQATYDSVQALTTDNAVKVELSQKNDLYFGEYVGIPAAKIDQTVYACAYAVDNEGNTYYSGVLADSPMGYSEWEINNSSNVNLVNCMKRLVKYGHVARECFIK